jgi:hypothetical protein
MQNWMRDLDSLSPNLNTHLRSLTIMTTGRVCIAKAELIEKLDSDMIAVDPESDDDFDETT